MKMEHFKYVSVLPTVNTSANVVILASQKENLAELWFEYMQEIVSMSMKSDGIQRFKLVREAMEQSKEVHLIKRENVRKILGVGSDFSVIDIVLENGVILKRPLMGFEELISIYYDETSPSLDKTVIDRFLVYLWSKEILLFSLTERRDNFQRMAGWSYFIKKNELYDALYAWCAQNEVSVLQPFLESSLFTLLSTTSWKCFPDVKEEDLYNLEQCNRKNENTIGYRRTIALFGELRRMLIDSSRNDIQKPIDIITASKNYDKKRKFQEVDIKLYPNLKDIVQKAYGYHDVLKKEGLAVGTINGDLSAVSNFLKYLQEHYADKLINQEAVDEMFHPDNEFGIFTVLSRELKSAKATLNRIIKFLVHCELYSINALKNTPKPKRRVSLAPYREAMPKEMVRHIVDIIKNRPPLLKTSWNRNKADISWWEHEVYPVYPLIMLFGYYIPLRGEQVRNLCRAKSFIFAEDGSIKTIVVNTDKNVNRKYLQEIPCVWDDLQIFAPFLKWHKEYYKHMPLTMYHDDENSPWDDIEPLFNTPFILKPVSSHTHMAYHKKVLCQYQLELMQEAKQNAEESYPVVAWAKDDKKFFKNIEELNRCSVKRMSEIEVMYDLHSLRVTGATRYIESGVGINLVMQLTGHVTPDTLLRIYINLTQEEKKKKLKSAIKEIYFGDSKTLLQSTSDLIAGEFVDAFQKDKEHLKSALKDNGLFSLERKLPQGTNDTKNVLGSEIALVHHPSNWFGMVHGICPAVKCPDGREHRCSLCPYLITGRLFINGIMLKANQTLAKFQRDSLQKREEEQKHYKNQALAESLELTLEEILGWQEIISKIEQDLDTDVKETNNMPTKAKERVSFEVIEEELAYLSNAYEAKLMGVEQDRMGMKILTIKAMKLANAQADQNAFNSIVQSEKGAIDFLMSYYVDKRIESKGFQSFLENLKS